MNNVCKKGDDCLPKNKMDKEKSTADTIYTSSKIPIDLIEIFFEFLINLKKHNLTLDDAIARKDEIMSILIKLNDSLLLS